METKGFSSMFAITLMMFVFEKTHCYVEMPKFSQLTLLYPGYHLHGGTTRNHDIPTLIGGNHSNVIRNLHNTSPLRLSIALNKYSGRHAIGMEPISLDGEGVISIQGSDLQQYIFHNTAFGPFLAHKYGNPLLGKPSKHDPTKTMDPFRGKQGIVRFVSYHTDHAGGHIGLWDCDHLIQSPDWTTEHHMISVEFWESPDSYCAPKDDSMDLHMLLQNFRLVPRDPAMEAQTRQPPVLSGGQTWNHAMDIPQNSPSLKRAKDNHKIRHSKRVRNQHHRLKEILLRH